MAKEDWFGVFGNDPFPYAIFASGTQAHAFIRDTYGDGAKAYRVGLVTAPVVQAVSLVACPQCEGAGQVRAVSNVGALEVRIPETEAAQDCFVTVKVEIHCGACGRLGPLTWGRVKWGHRTYFVIGFSFLSVWI